MSYLPCKTKLPDLGMVSVLLWVFYKACYNVLLMVLAQEKYAEHGNE